MAFVHDLLTQGPSDVVIDGINRRLPIEWDDIEGIIDAAKAADAALALEAVEQALKGEITADPRVRTRLIELVQAGRIRLDWQGL